MATPRKTASKNPEAAAATISSEQPAGPDAPPAAAPKSKSRPEKTSDAHEKGKDRIALVAGLRTPFVRSWSDLNDVDPVELSTQVARELLYRMELKPQDVDQVVWGSVVSVVRSPNVAREVALNLGMFHASGYSVSRACASGFQAIAAAAEMIWAGQAEIVLAGGVDVVSHAPVTYKKRVIDSLLKLQKAKGLALLKELGKVNPMDLLPSPPALTERFTGMTMGEHAEEMAQNFGISRASQDEFSMRSHQKANAATQAGLLKDEIMTVQTPKGPVSQDNIIRADMDAAKLAKLKPVFDRRNGTITAASSSSLTEGAAAILVMRESKAKELGYKPMGYLRSYAFSGQDPRENMLLGNVYSTPLALDRAGLKLADVDLIEVHEAFAAQVLSNLKMFEDKEFFRTKLGRDDVLGPVPAEKLNVRGGSLAFGHPFAATGVRLITSLLRTLAHENKNLGLATACAAGGMGAAMIVERR